MRTSTRQTCLHCDKTAYQRGLCTTHYSRFATEKKKIPIEKQDAFDEGMVAAGKIMPPGKRGKKIDEDDPFAGVAGEFLKVAEDATKFEDEAAILNGPPKIPRKPANTKKPQSTKRKSG